MKAICIANTLTTEQKKSVSLAYRKSDFHITIGMEYLVFGLTLVLVDGNLETSIQYLSDYGNLVHSPIQLFDITDNRVSKYWQMKIDETGDILFWPPSFYQEYYHDDLFEDIPEIKADFKIVKKLLEEEFIDG